MWRPPKRLTVVLFLLLVSARPSWAELVVFSYGHVLKVDSFEVKDQTVRLTFSSGGSLQVSLNSIERIVDDEVLPPEPREVLEPEASVEIKFRAEHEVPDTPYGNLIFAAAERHGLNPTLVAAVVRAESAFDVSAVSVKGARGLMQLMPATARRFGVPTTDLFNPARNLEAGTSYLKWLAKRYENDLPRILAAYNAGETNVERYGGVPPFRETRGYIKRIYGYLGLPLATL